jgi:hypothetical protein
MRVLLVVVAIVASAMLCAGYAWAQELERQQARERRPGLAAMTAVGNVVYVPVRFAWTVFNAGVGGLTGALTAGDAHAARDVFDIGTGQGYLQPEMLSGEESLRFGEQYYNLSR